LIDPLNNPQPASSVTGNPAENKDIQQNPTDEENEPAEPKG